MNRREQDQALNPKSRRTALAFFARVYWMMFGYIPVFASTAAIIQSEGGHTGADAAFWASVSSIVLVRLYDVARLDGTTAEGAPATLAHWRRYAGSLAVVALVVWSVAHFIRTM